MRETPFTRALSLLPPAGDRSRSEIHATADEYERWLVLQQLDQQITNDKTSERTLSRKSYVIGRQAEERLGVLRQMLSDLPSQDLGELARKARILRFDASPWLEDDDPLHQSVCDDVLRIAGTQPLPEPFPVPAEVLQRLRDLDFDAPPLPWEDEL